MILTYVLMAIGLYFLPTIIAFHKKKVNRTAIMILNIFLGWTFIAWVIALMMSVSADK